MEEIQKLNQDIAAEDVLFERQNETLKIIAEIYQIRKHNSICFILAVIFGTVFFISSLLFYMEADYFRLGERFGQWIPTVELIAAILSYPGMALFIKLGKWNKATELFKDKLVAAILKEEFDEVTYIPDEGISYTQAAGMKVIFCGNRLYSEDYVEGEYKGYHFALAECCAEEIIGRDYNTVFFGKILDLDYNKETVVDVYVCGRNFSYPNPVQYAKKRVEMESMDFNNNYTVYCGQNEMAFYVLTPQVQEALLELGRTMNYDMAVNFSGRHLYVAITQKNNTLELPRDKYINYMKERARIKQEMGFVKAVLETLPLCQSTGELRYLQDGYIVKKPVAMAHGMLMRNKQSNVRIFVIILLAGIILFFVLGMLGIMLFH